MRQTRKFDVCVSLMILVCVGVSACSGVVAGNSGGDEAGSGGDGAFGGSLGGGAPSPAPVSACKGDATVPVGRWRRLTAEQYTNTVRDLLGQAADTSGFLSDSRTGPFTTNALLPLQESDVDNYGSVAETLAKKAVANLTGLVNCNTAAMGEDACAAQFIKDFGARAFRRPLTTDEESDFKAVYTAGKADSYQVGIRLVVEAALQSPTFLYMVEVGSTAKNGIKALTGYEVASRLSYLLTGSMPDAALFASARKGELNTPAGISDVAKRLMTGSTFSAQAGKFHTELLGVDALRDETKITKPSEKYPSFDTAMRAAMLDEPRKFVDYVMTKGSGTVEELLTGAYVFPTGPLAKTYGNLNVDGDGRAQVSDGTRSGLLTLASTQAAHPVIPTLNPSVNRGHMVRRDFLCETVPPPPKAVDFTPPPNAAQLTPQELSRLHQSNPTCNGCHRLMDSIGFGFGSYDLAGAYRAKDDNGKPIDTSGEIVGLQDSGTFKDAREMSQRLAQLPEVRNCLSIQWFRYALGRDPQDADACTQQLVTDALSKGKGSIKDALLALVTSDSFRFKGEQ